jgi:8-oxo-dGTP diphosphatase
MQDFVAGFLLDDTGRVALVRKKRPAWQAGRLNAIGGKVEAGEDAPQAMRREFREETGVDIGGWEHFVRLELSYGAVDFFRRHVGADVLDQVRATTDEPIEIHAADAIPSEALANLAWLVPLARYTHDQYELVVVREV